MPESRSYEERAAQDSHDHDMELAQTPGDMKLYMKHSRTLRSLLHLQVLGKSFVLACLSLVTRSVMSFARWRIRDKEADALFCIQIYILGRNNVKTLLLHCIHAQDYER